MRVLLIVALLGFLPPVLRADFSYQVTTQIIGGVLFDDSAKPVSVTRLFKGNRMAEASKGHITVVNLEKEFIVQIDLVKKTYSVTPFPDVKQAAEKTLPTTAPVVKVSVSATGQTKKIGVLTASQTIITISTEPENGPFTAGVVAWIATIPGYDEVRNFERKLGEKMGYAFASGMSSLAMGRAEALEGFGEAARALAKIEGAPIEKTVKIAEGATVLVLDSTETVPSRQSAASAALGRIGVGHKKQATPAPSAPGRLIVAAVELSNFSLAPIDVAKFEVPPGFKQVQPPKTDR
jgi:hypothetical protein